MKRSEQEICGTCKFCKETQQGDYCENDKSSRKFTYVKEDYSCESWRDSWNALSEYIHRHKITLDGREYVDKKAFTELVTRKMLVEAKGCESVDEKLGFEMCIQIIENL